MQEIVDRRSVRKYLTQEIDEDKILQLLESARLAPSGSNTQPWRFIIVRSKEIKERLMAVDHHQEWMLDAPVFIVCVADSSCRMPDVEHLYLDENSPEPELKLIIRDTAIAIQNLLLEAEHIGLSTCWTAWFCQKDVREILNIPSNHYVSGIVCIGYGNEKPSERPRRMLKDMLYDEVWGNPSSLKY